MRQSLVQSQEKRLFYRPPLCNFFVINLRDQRLNFLGVQKRTVLHLSCCKRNLRVVCFPFLCSVLYSYILTQRQRVFCVFKHELQDERKCGRIDFVTHNVFEIETFVTTTRTTTLSVITELGCFVVQHHVLVPDICTG